MKRKLAVITGTFNPVTNAHMELGKFAKEKLGDSCQVVYVPAKASFLRTWKHMESKDIIPDADRYQMLMQAASKNGFLCDSCEIYDTVPGNTYLTLEYLADKYKMRKQDVYYVCGSDKLSELNRWSYAEKLVNEYQFLIVRRNFDDVEEIIQKNSFLEKRREHFIIMDSSPENQSISSTMVRDAIKERKLEDVKEIIPDIVYQELERKC